MDSSTMVVRGELPRESKDLLDSTNLFSSGVQLDGLNLKIFKDIKSKYVIFNQVKIIQLNGRNCVYTYIFFLFTA